MSLTFIFGGAGSGKSTLLRDRIIKASMKDPGIRHILLVPEQFTMQTQRDILAAHPRHASLNIEIMSFERLAYHVMGEQAGKSFVLLTDMGKQMLLRRAAEDKKSALTVFSGSIRKTGFLRSLAGMISEFYQYDAGDLEELAGRFADQPLLKRKLTDLGIIKKAFEERRTDEKITAEELLPGLLKLLPETDYMSGCRLYIDSFTGFTPVQLKLLDLLLSRTSHMEIALLLPEKEAEDKEIRQTDLFFLGKKTARELKQMAEKKEIPCEEIILKGNIRHRSSPELAFLTEHFLRYGRKEQYTEEVNSISVIRARNEAAEASFAAGTINRLVKEEGYRYRDIAVVTGDPETYRRYLVTAFSRAGIPYFCDSTKGLSGDPLAEMILSALEAVSSDFSYESVMRFLRCGISPVSPEEADLLDTYLYITGIRGKSAYQKDFEWCPEKFLEDDMPAVNSVRSRFLDTIAPLLALGGKQEHSGSEWTSALKELLEKTGAACRMQELASFAAAEGDVERADEYSRVAEYMDSVIAETEALFPEEPFDAEGFLKILEAGIAEGKLGMLPKGMDQVQIGDLLRSRQTGIRALLVLGMNDGLIPSAGSGGGILSEAERKTLLGRGVELAPEAFDMACQERAYLYMLLSRPQDKLFLTFHTQDSQGNAVRPSYLLPQFMAMYEKLGIRSEEDLETAEMLAGRTSLGLAFADHLLKKTEEAERKAPDPAYDVLASVLYNDSPETFFRILEAAFPAGAGDGIRPETAGLLYGRDIRLSVTRLESFARCAAAHFLKYGLRLHERKKFAVDQMDRGTFFHKVMQLFFEMVTADGRKIGALTEEEREEYTARAVMAAKRDEKISRMESESAEGAYRSARFAELLDRGIRAMCASMKKSGFNQEISEMFFSGYEDERLIIHTGNGSRLIPEGKIDRVDVCEEDGKRYVRVVDYKTGSKGLDLSETYDGLSVQLVLYLAAAMLKDGKRHPESLSVPAGMYYFSFAEKIKDAAAEESEESLYRKWLKGWQLDGLTAEDDQAAAHMEAVSGKSAGTEDIRRLIAHTQRKMRETGERIVAGETAAMPVKDKDRKACEWCPYSAVCRFDKKSPLYDYRYLTRRSDDEIWSMLGEEDPDGSDLD